MGLMTCKDCGGQVSTNSRNCPHCGRLTSMFDVSDKERGAMNMIVGVIFLIVLAIIGYNMIGDALSNMFAAR